MKNHWSFMNHIDGLHINAALFFSDRVSSHNRIRLQSGIEDISSALPQQLLTPHTWTYTFSAKEKDTETGYSYFGSRYYSSDLSIWLSVDPMAGKYPGLSPYTYCADNPVRCMDPNGESFGNPPYRDVTITIGGTPNGSRYQARTYPENNGKQYSVPIYSLTVTGTNSKGENISRTWDVLRFMPYLNQNPQSSGYKQVTGSTPIMSGLSDERHSTIRCYNPNYKVHNSQTPENGGFVIYGNFMIHDGPDNADNTGWGAAGCMEVMGDEGFMELKTFIFDLSGSQNPNTEQGLLDFVSSGKLYINIEQSERPPVEPVN